MSFLAGVVVGLCAAVLVERLSRDEGLELVRTVRDLARSSFVGNVEPRELEESAVRGMLARLDHYSKFYGPEEVAALDRETSGEFRGIGVVFRRPVAEGQILFPFPDSPAERAGLRVGDTLLAIGGAPVSEMEPGDLQARIKRAGAGSIRFLVQDLAGGKREVEVHPERIVDPTIRHARIIDSEYAIGYLAILSFSHRTAMEFDDVIRFLREEGLEALVIDLRGNPGGILDAATLIANRFIEEGRLVATRTRRLTQVTLAKTEEATCAGLPLAILIDGGSASASEVLAGALQDHGVAVLIGEPSFGKGTVQTITALPRFRSRVKITTATYYTPAWRRIEGDGEGGVDAGIAPDIEVPLDAKTRGALYAHLATYSPPPAAVPAIRAWEEAEGLTLIAPVPVDVQLRAAIDLLRGDLHPGDARRER